LMLEKTVAVRVCTIDDLGVCSDSGASGISGIANGNEDGTNCGKLFLENNTTSDL